MSRRFRFTTARGSVVLSLAALFAVSCSGSYSSPNSVPSPPTSQGSPAPAPTPTPDLPTPVPSPTPAEPAPTPTPTPAPAPTTVTITILGINGGMSFSPSQATVRLGDLVRWRNGDVIAHTATQVGGGFDTGLIAPGATSAPITLSTTGTIDYFCAIHPVMVGAVRVTP